MRTKLSDIQADDVVDADLLITEGRLAIELWHKLTIPGCPSAHNSRCEAVCPNPCTLADACIDRIIPGYFLCQLRWN
ncbi:hypothetical protein LCGC14_2787830 [marine sediment metagenome]|uniref:Uncharacterized protein n=1 Tax=marine sediment metagenome TaxID=412755 RepID=A0A0F8YRG5_9ZZZZ